MSLARPVPMRAPRPMSAGMSSNPSERDRQLRAVGVEPNPLVPLSHQWAAPRSWKDGVFKQGAVVLAGDMLLEALNGDAIAHAELKERQERRRQQRIRQMAMEKAQNSVDVQWQVGKGTPGRPMVAKRMCILRRTPDLSSEKVGKVPKGATIYVLEMQKPTPEGIRRALVQDTWGKSSGWLTAVDVDGEACLGPPAGPAAPPGFVEGCDAYEADDSDRSNWLKPEFQHENWKAKQLPKCARPRRPCPVPIAWTLHALFFVCVCTLSSPEPACAPWFAGRTDDNIEGQQERDGRKRMQLKQKQHHDRQEIATGAAGKKSVVEKRPGGAGAGFRSAAAMRSR